MPGMKGEGKCPEGVRGPAPGESEDFQRFLGPQGEKRSKKDEGAGLHTPFHTPSITEALITFA